MGEEHLVEAGKIPGVFQPDRALDHMFQPRTRVAQGGDDVLDGLLGLLDNAALHHLGIGADRDLARDEDIVTGLDGAGEWHAAITGTADAAETLDVAHGVLLTRPRPAR